MPGPNQPKDVDSFLAPLYDDAWRPANGIDAYDCEMDSCFKLHAYIHKEDRQTSDAEQWTTDEDHRTDDDCRVDECHRDCLSLSMLSMLHCFSCSAYSACCYKANRNDNVLL